MNALIIEDEIMAQKSLTRALTQNFPDINIIAYLDSVKGAVEWLREKGNSIDVIFMDVELSDGVCFEIFKQIDVKAKIIMTTAYDSYALKAFEAGSVDYLLKPIEAEPLKRAVARCRMSGGGVDVERLMKLIEGGQQSKAAKEYKERYIVRFNDRIVPLNISDIAYIYAEEKNNYLVTFNGQKYIIDSSLDVINEELNPNVFFKISRSCIVAMNAIKSITKQPGGRLRIDTNPAPPYEMTVSRSRVEDFLVWLER
jgi:DNA-binding LytR/AlgR family response regulator